MEGLELLAEHEDEVEDARAHDKEGARKKSLLILLVVVLVTVAAVIVLVIVVVPIAVVFSTRSDESTELLPNIEVNTTLLAASGQWVTVAWDNVIDPSEADWIGVYTSPIDARNHAPIKFLPQLTQSNGSSEFRLVNMRKGIIFAFFRQGLDHSEETATFNNPIPVAVSEVVQFQNQNEPLQAHLSLTRDPTEMTLTWVSYNATEPTVMWGTRSGDYTFVKEANTTSYNASDLCGSPASDFGYIDPGLIHHAKMDNLVPGTRYYYIFGDPFNSWSKEYSFMAAPEPGIDVTTRVIAFGDLGNAHHDDAFQVIRSQQEALNTVRRIQDELDETDLLLHLGDISYARGYASVWEFFFDEIQPIATRVPYMVCIGNHERDWPNSGSFYEGVDSGGECGIPHEVRFPMPRPSLDEAWWGLDYGSIHYIMMSTEHDFTPTSRQYQFLESELRSVNHSRTPWIIVGGHRPMYAFSHNVDGVLVGEELQQSLEELFMNHSVNVALWGHEHSYQRTCPVYNGTCITPEEGGIVHVVVAMAGQKLSTPPYPSESLPPWLETLDYRHYGFLRIIANATTLVTEFVWNDDGEVHDRLVLTKF